MSSAEETPKIPYEKPAVVDYGSIAENTFSKGAGPLDFAGRRVLTP